MEKQDGASYFLPHLRTALQAAVQKPATLPSVWRCGLGDATRWSWGSPCKDWVVPWNREFCGIQAKGAIQQDTGHSKTSYDVHMSPEGEARSESGVCGQMREGYTTVEFSSGNWVPQWLHRLQVEAASSSPVKLGCRSRRQD